MRFSNSSPANLQFAKCAATVWTILYLFALPFLFLKALASHNLLQDPTMTHFSAMTLITMDYVVVFIIPLSLYKMWSSYAQKMALKTHVFGLLPLIAFFIYIFLRIEFLDLFLQRVIDGPK